LVADDEIRNYSDRELIDGCIAFDRQCQENLYRRFANKMYNVCLTYSETEEEAADVLQEGFIKVFRKIDHFRFEGSLEGWVRRIIINTALEIHRKKTIEKNYILSYSMEFDEEPEDVLVSFDAQDIIALINGLPFKAQIILKLFAIEGYNHKEIAEMMGISEGTSKSQLNRARSLIKQTMLKKNAI
jgi:RNA polymerase sigma-70 factor (ECF subfamily)